MSTFTTVIHIITCVLIVLVVLLQSGKGAEISATLSGSSQTVFGSSGGANFFSRLTSILAAIFFCTSIYLTILSNQSRKSLFETGAVPVTSSATTTTAPTSVAPTTTAPATAPATTTETKK